LTSDVTKQGRIWTYAVNPHGLPLNDTPTSSFFLQTDDHYSCPHLVCPVAAKGNKFSQLSHSTSSSFGRSWVIIHLYHPVVPSPIALGEPTILEEEDEDMGHSPREIVRQIRKINLLRKSMRPSTLRQKELDSFYGVLVRTASGTCNYKIQTI
jgi:hypothetical protein